MSLSILDLKQFSLLSVFTDDQLKKIKQLTRFHEFKKNENIILEGEFANELFFVMKGWLKAEKVSREGRQQTLRFIGPGEVVNELSVFSNEKSNISVVAMEPVVAFSISKSQIDQQLIIVPSFSVAVIKSLAKRMQHLLNHIENLSLYPVEVRLARFLLDGEEKGIVARQTWKTQSEIANQLGTVLDVLNRNLQNLVKEGYILIDRNQIKIIDIKGLKKIANG